MGPGQDDDAGVLVLGVLAGVAAAAGALGAGADALDASDDLALSLLVAVVAEEALASVLASPPSLAPPVLPPRKSVTYQPEPLSWKPAAVTCLAKAGLPQAGQSVKGGSDIFCKKSLAWPQDSHL
jgi:hypothetical protein